MLGTIYSIILVGYKQWNMCVGIQGDKKNKDAKYVCILCGKDRGRRNFLLVFCCKSLTVMRRIVNLDKNLAFL
jgi:hypothetical protein